MSELKNKFETDKLDFAFVGAISRSDIEAGKKLIGQGVNASTAREKKGYTALSYACGMGLFDIVRWLVEDLKVDVNERNIVNGKPTTTAAFWVSGPDGAKIAKLLIDNGYKVNISEPDYDQTALFFAENREQYEVAEIYRRAGGTLHARNEIPEDEMMREVEVINNLFGTRLG